MKHKAIILPYNNYTRLYIRTELTVVLQDIGYGTADNRGSKAQALDLAKKVCLVGLLFVTPFTRVQCQTASREHFVCLATPLEILCMIENT